MGKLDGKVTVVTGGASGIGEATVRLFLDEGCRVVIADIQDETGQQIAREFGEKAVYAHTDVRVEAEVQAILGKAVAEYGRLDCVFNNAGIGEYFNPIEEITVAQFDRIVGIHLRGVFLGMKYAAPIMKRQRSGSIISTSSVAGLQAGNAGHIYSAAKAAVIHLTRTVAAELGESGVRVNCICPGYVPTLIFAVPGAPSAGGDRILRVLEEEGARRQPLGRPGRPIDIARAALWLASDDSSYVTGQALVVDGGATCGRMWSEVLKEEEKLRRKMEAEG